MTREEGPLWNMAPILAKTGRGPVCGLKISTQHIGRGDDERAGLGSRDAASQLRNEKRPNNCVFPESIRERRRVSLSELTAFAIERSLGPRTSAPF